MENYQLVVWDVLMKKEKCDFYDRKYCKNIKDAKRNTS